jgi:ectoine hydroxylase-related dioxygenase (phytanoyl-CoA dioxygenase family)
VKNPEIVGCVARYLKCFPILTYVAVWYSPNDLQDQTGSQKYHLDHEDFKQIKAFMAIEDVAKENGPFTLIPASESDRIQKKLGYTMTPENKQVDDEKMYEVISRDSAKPFVGSAGTLALVDTSRCFHYGSREGTKPRILLTFQYMTPFAYVMPWNWKKKPSLDHLHSENLPEFERKLLGLTA